MFGVAILNGNIVEQAAPVGSFPHGLEGFRVDPGETIPVLPAAAERRVQDSTVSSRIFRCFRVPMKAAIASSASRAAWSTVSR